MDQQGGRVEPGILIGQRLVIEQVGQVGRNLGEHVIRMMADDHTGRTGILLCAGIDHGIFGRHDRDG